MTGVQYVTLHMKEFKEKDSYIVIGISAIPIEELKNIIGISIKTWALFYYGDIKSNNS